MASRKRKGRYKRKGTASLAKLFGLASIQHNPYTGEYTVIHNGISIGTYHRKSQALKAKRDVNSALKKLKG